MIGTPDEVKIFNHFESKMKQYLIPVKLNQIKSALNLIICIIFVCADTHSIL